MLIRELVDRLAPKLRGLRASSASRRSRLRDPNGLGWIKAWFGRVPEEKQTVNATQYTLSGLGSGGIYIAVTAYDTPGRESWYSNEVMSLWQAYLSAVLNR